MYSYDSINSTVEEKDVVSLDTEPRPEDPPQVDIPDDEEDELLGDDGSNWVLTFHTGPAAHKYA